MEQKPWPCSAREQQVSVASEVATPTKIWSIARSCNRISCNVANRYSRSLFPFRAKSGLTRPLAAFSCLFFAFSSFLCASIGSLWSKSLAIWIFDWFAFQNDAQIDQKSIRISIGSSSMRNFDFCNPLHAKCLFLFFHGAWKSIKIHLLCV